MQCPDHPENTATAFCRNCGRGVCGECAGEIQGVPHCPACKEKLAGAAEKEAAAAPETPPPPRETPAPPPYAVYEDPKAPHPFLAGMLGLLPGLGAVYNGQYVKGFIHVIIFGVLMSIAVSTDSSVAPLFAPIIALFFLYMPIEAVRTAQALRRGEEVDELSGAPAVLLRESSRSPLIGAGLIVFGVFILLLNLDIVDIREVAPFWPLILIAIGAYQLLLSVQRIRSGDSPTAAPPPAADQTPADADVAQG